MKFLLIMCLLIVSACADTEKDLTEGKEWISTGLYTAQFYKKDSNVICLITHADNNYQVFADTFAIGDIIHVQGSEELLQIQERTIDLEKNCMNVVRGSHGTDASIIEANGLIYLLTKRRSTYG